MRTARIAIVALSLLAGCVPAPRGDQPATYVERRDALMALDHWIMKGRIGVKLEQRGFTGAIHWTQNGERIEMRFHGPLGAAAFKLSGEPDDLVLETGNGERYLIDDAEGALDARLGWSVPVAAMRYWLLGLPYPPWPAMEQLDDEGRLVRLQQNDWTIDYDRYAADQNWIMPRKLLIQSSEVNVRLSVHDWVLGRQASVAN